MVKNGKVDLESNRPEVLGATRILDGVQGVLRPQAAHHGDTAIRSVDNCFEQLRPFAVVKVRSFAHRGRDLEQRLSGAQALVYPPFGKLGHRPGVQRVASVECGWYGRNGPLDQESELIAVHFLKAS